MADQLDINLKYARSLHNQTLEDLKEFVRIPSVSTDPNHKSDILEAANWIAEKLRGLGAESVAIMPTAGHPVVYAELLGAGPSKPTVLVYGHYDVQPAEPFELWETPPFEPSQRGENLYGRGASDMKGQVIICLKSVEAFVQNGELPVNVKFLIEGEEEIGSPNLDEFIATHKALLASDFALNPDAGMISADLPTITYGLRGLAYFELRISGPAHDLHSGLYGGVVHNPAQVLCELIAGMHDQDGHITLPGFYDHVRPLEEVERLELQKLPQDEKFYLQQTGAPALYGEKGYYPVERVGVRPTLEVNGLLSGFTGEGTKTVLPAEAMAKISMRLVPDQDPEHVHEQLKEYLLRHAPPTIRWKIIQFAGSPASITDREMKGAKALGKALEDTWGTRPVFKREGGSVPVVAQMKKILGIESVLTGFGLPDDNLHAPNEKIHLPTFYKGIEAFIRYLNLLGSP